MMFARTVLVLVVSLMLTACVAGLSRDQQQKAAQTNAQLGDSARPLQRSDQTRPA